MKNILTCCCLLFNIFIFAQQDSVKIKEFHHKNLLVRGFVGTKKYEFTLKRNFLGTGEQINYESIEKVFLGTAVHYDGFGGHIWIGLPIYLSHKIPHQDNKAIDIQANFYKKRVVIDANFQNYEGLFLANAQQFTLPSDEQGHLFRKDLHLSSLSGNLIYEFNKEFSLASGFTQTKRQTTSLGTPLFMTTIEWDNFQADSNIVPRQSQIYHQLQNKTLNYGNFIAWAMGGGYGYNLIFREKYFISLLGTAGPSLQWQKMNNENGQIVVNYHYNLRWGMGYNGNKWITGITFVRDYQNYHFTGIHSHLAKQHFKVFVGYRFHYDLNQQIKEMFHF